MQSDKNLYQADIQTVSLLKDMRQNVHNICKEHAEQKVRIEAIDGQIIEGVIVDYDDHNVYVEVEDPEADNEDQFPYQQVAGRNPYGGWDPYKRDPYWGYGPYGGYSPYGEVSPYGAENISPSAAFPYPGPQYPYGQVSPFGVDNISPSAAFPYPGPPYPYGQVNPFADDGYPYSQVSPYTGYGPYPYQPYPPYPPVQPYYPYPAPPPPPPIVAPETRRRRRRRGCKIIPLALFTLLSIALI